MKEKTFRLVKKRYEWVLYCIFVVLSFALFRSYSLTLKHKHKHEYKVSLSLICTLFSIFTVVFAANLIKLKHVMDTIKHYIKEYNFS